MYIHIKAINRNTYIYIYIPMLKLCRGSCRRWCLSSRLGARSGARRRAALHGSHFV